MYAVIEDSGRQFKVSSGDRLLIDRAHEEGVTSVTFDRVLLIGGDGPARIGAPVVAGATVTAEVLGPKKGPKIDIVKHRRRKGYERKIGHRQQYLEVKITGINA
jgi:large subunit ribosomal protein L21